MTATLESVGGHTDLLPGEVSHLMIVRELEVGRPLEAVLGVLHERCAQ